MSIFSCIYFMFAVIMREKKTAFSLLLKPKKKLREKNAKIAY